MQVSLETTQGLERRLTIAVPADSVEELVKKRLREISKTTRIDGFRKGKVPVSVIEKRFGQQAFAEVVQDAMQQNYIQALIQEKINPAGAPYFEPKNLERGKELEFTATFEVYPEVEVKDIEKIEVERPVAEVTDADLETMMETLQKQQATWTEKKVQAKEGHKVTMDFVGTIDGEEFEGGRAEDFELELGQGRMIPGFEDGIIGKKSAKKAFSIEVKFPEEYHAENLKGKDAVFEITLKKVEVQELPELNDEFVEKFGIADGGVDALKAEVRNNMTRELGQALKGKVKEAAIKGLLETNTFDVPKAIVDQEVNNLRQQAMQRFGGQVDPANMPELPAELFEQQAKDRVRTGLLLGQFIKDNEIKADEGKVKEIIDTQASAYEDPSEVVDHYYGNEQLLENIRNLATEDQAIELLLEKAKVSEKSYSFDEIMNPQQG
jgi:trigger factor